MGIPKDPDVAFFYRNAGYGKPPGRFECAQRLAEAERYAKERNWEFVWEYDEDADWSWMDEEEQNKYHEVFGCRMFTGTDTVDPFLPAQSLYGIFDPSDDHRRVVQAELALEEMPEEDPMVKLLKQLEKRRRKS